MKTTDIIHDSNVFFALDLQANELLTTSPGHIFTFGLIDGLLFCNRYIISDYSGQNYVVKGEGEVSFEIEEGPSNQNSEEDI